MRASTSGSPGGATRAQYAYCHGNSTSATSAQSSSSRTRGGRVRPSAKPVVRGADGQVTWLSSPISAAAALVFGRGGAWARAWASWTPQRGWLKRRTSWRSPSLLRIPFTRACMPPLMIESARGEMSAMRI